MKLPAASCGVSKRNCDEAEPPSLCDQCGHPAIDVGAKTDYPAASCRVCGEGESIKNLFVLT